MAYKYPYNDEEIKRDVKAPKLQTNRSMLKLMVLTLLTFGIYSIFFFIPFSFDLDKIAPKKDHSRTMNYLFVFILAFFTFSIVIDVWLYHIASRVEEALTEHGIEYEFGTHDFWGWLVFGSFLIVGPFVYYHKLCKAMNLLCKHYNEEHENT